MIRKIKRFIQLPTSRKIQSLSFLFSQIITTSIYRWRLKECGRDNIVQRPIFWTPEFISIGNNVFIWQGCRIEGIDRYSHEEFQPHIVIGDNVSFQQHCHVTAASSLYIGKNTTILFNVLITDIDHSYNQLGINVSQQPLNVRATRIGENCFLGAGAKIQAGTILGDHCIVGANAVIRGVFPDYCVVVGAPGRIVKRFDSTTGLWRKTNSSGDFL